MPFGKDRLQELLYQMVLTRKLDEALARVHRERRLVSPLGLRSGLEAVAVGAASVPGREDAIASSLPTVGTWLVRGVSPRELVSQFLGTSEAPSQGRDGLAGLGDLDRGVVAAGDHAAIHVSVIAGIAFSSRITGKEKVAIAITFEEAVASGDFHEGLNFAAVHKVPLVVLVVRIPFSGKSTGPDGTRLYERARGYGVATLPVDGSDLLQVVEVIETAVARARRGEGPTLIEARVRSSMWYEGNDGATPTALGEKSWQFAAPASAVDSDADAIGRFERFLLEHDWLGEKEKSDLASRAEETVADAMRVAQAAN
ncbi:MAG TPA: thiamine pyrophosphate-dependent enzyme [Vicinamibacteria bacterium]|nr:thiamine pyrophosphate-dependent enzyme [Vicinamibacteria bacterium]